MSSAPVTVPNVLGYWFRFDPRRRTLHLARWVKTEAGGLVVEAACGAQVIEPRAPEVPQGLLIQPTPADALRVADQTQRHALCTRCSTVRTP